MKTKTNMKLFALILIVLFLCSSIAVVGSIGVVQNKDGGNQKQVIDYNYQGKELWVKFEGRAHFEKVDTIKYDAFLKEKTRSTSDGPATTGGTGKDTKKEANNNPLGTPANPYKDLTQYNKNPKVKDNKNIGINPIYIRKKDGTTVRVNSGESASYIAGKPAQPAKGDQPAQPAELGKYVIKDSTKAKRIVREEREDGTLIKYDYTKTADKTPSQTTVVFDDGREMKMKGDGSQFSTQELYVARQTGEIDVEFLKLHFQVMKGTYESKYQPVPDEGGYYLIGEDGYFAMRDKNGDYIVVKQKNFNSEKKTIKDPVVYHKDGSYTRYDGNINRNSDGSLNRNYEGSYGTKTFNNDGTLRSQVEVDEGSVKSAASFGYGTNGNRDSITAGKYKGRDANGKIQYESGSAVTMGFDGSKLHVGTAYGGKNGDEPRGELYKDYHSGDYMLVTKDSKGNKKITRCSGECDSTVFKTDVSKVVSADKTKVMYTDPEVQKQKREAWQQQQAAKKTAGTPLTDEEKAALAKLQEAADKIDASFDEDDADGTDDEDDGLTVGGDVSEEPVDTDFDGIPDVSDEIWDPLGGTTEGYTKSEKPADEKPVDEKPADEEKKEETELEVEPEPTEGTMQEQIGKNQKANDKADGLYDLYSFGMGHSRWLNDLGKITENRFAGLAGWSSLAQRHSPEYAAFMHKWRDAIDTMFCELIPVTIDCLVSAICETGWGGGGFVTGADSSELPSNVAFVTDPATGALVPIAHVEMERTQPIIKRNISGSYTTYIYKVSYFVSNPDNPKGDTKRMKFSVYFLRDGHVVKTAVNQKRLEIGESWGATGETMKIFESSNYYDQIRIDFDPGLPDWRGHAQWGGGGFWRSYHAVREITAPVIQGGTGGSTPPVATPAVGSELDGAAAPGGEDWG